MITDATVALVRAGTPIRSRVLGLHAGADGRLWVRALLPAARPSPCSTRDSGKPSLASLPRRHETACSKAACRAAQAASTIGCAVRWDNGATQALADAYAFGPQLGEAELQALRARAATCGPTTCSARIR